jgi:hypothetical protein
VKDANGRFSHILLMRDGRKTEAKRLVRGPKPSAATNETTEADSLFNCELN